MQAVAVEFSGCTENHLRSSSYGVSANRERSRHSEATAEFYCFLERRVLIGKNSSIQELKHSRTQEPKNPRTQEEPKVSRRGPHRSILAFLSTRVLEFIYFKLRSFNLLANARVRVQ